MMKVTIYQDGKACRGVEAEVIGRRAQSIRFKFTCLFGGEVITAWSRKRRKKGNVHEVINYNYWYYE